MIFHTCRIYLEFYGFATLVFDGLFDGFIFAFIATLHTLDLHLGSFGFGSGSGSGYGFGFV